jgi:hypothetical protein
VLSDLVLTVFRHYATLVLEAGNRPGLLWFRLLRLRLTKQGQHRALLVEARKALERLSEVAPEIRERRQAMILRLVPQVAPQVFELPQPELPPAPSDAEIPSWLESDDKKRAMAVAALLRGRPPLARRKRRQRHRLSSDRPRRSASWNR